MLSDLGYMMDLGLYIIHLFFIFLLHLLFLDYFTLTLKALKEKPTFVSLRDSGES